VTTPVVVERERRFADLREARRRAIERGDRKLANEIANELWRLGGLLAELETVEVVMPERAVVRKRRASVPGRRGRGFHATPVDS
jgi:hypothetical protein